MFMQGFITLRCAVALGCLAFVVTACGGGGGGSSPAPASLGAQVPPQSSVSRVRSRAVTCTPFQYSAPDLPPSCTAYVGAFVSPQNNESPTELIASTETFEQQIGRKLAMHLHYYQWTDAWPGIGEQDDLSNGRIPLISWHCGDTDARGPIFLRWKWEMNLVYSKKLCGDTANDAGWPSEPGDTHYNPQLFIQAWQHIRAVFAANGATNVVWVFNISSNGAPPALYYPGTNYVDWIGVDRYDTNAEQFSQTFLDSQKVPTPGEYPPCNQANGANYNGCLYTYPELLNIDSTKPYIIGETGIEQSNQPFFLETGANSAANTLESQFPQIQAFMYWDSTGGRGQYQLLQYGIEAFSQFAAGPYEQGYYNAQQARRKR
jgi:hypothetical protein